MKVPRTAKRSNQSILKEISLEYSLEKALVLEKIEGQRRREQQRMRWLDGIHNSMDMSLSKLLEVGDRQGGLTCGSPWGREESGMTELLN